MNLLSRAILAVLTAAVATGCARAGDDAAEVSDTQTVAGDLDETPQTAPTTEPSAPTADAPLAVSDLDAYARGVRAEIEAVEKAWTQLRGAKSGTDTLSAVFAATPGETQPTGASHAGVSLDRYRIVVDRVDRVFATRDMAAASAKMHAQIDTTTLDSTMRASVRQSISESESAWGDPYKGLEPDVADAIKKRTGQLDSLRLRLAQLRLGGGRAP